jgi:type IV pilus assembly protein PilW
MKNRSARPSGFTLIELMLSITIGLLIIAATIGLFAGQKQMYSSSNSLAAIQNADNAISGLVYPIVRASGFAGCGALVGSPSSVVSTLNAGAPGPLGGLNTLVTYIYGYESTNTGPTGSLSIATLDPPNDTSNGDWTPTLDTTLTADVQPGSDVLMVVGPVIGSMPISVTAATNGISTISTQNATQFSAGQIAAISDCGKTAVFGITGVSGNVLTHGVGSGTTGNSAATFVANFAPGAQVVPMQQTALFVGLGTDGHSDLMMAVYTGTGWTITPLIPGVDTMQVLYGTGSSDTVTSYVPASSVVDWTAVYSVRLGFLIEGEKGSTSGHTVAGSTFTVLGTTVTVPSDGILRHVNEVTINLRNL